MDSRGTGLHSEITQAVIGAAMAVLNELKAGLDWKRIVRTRTDRGWAQMGADGE